MSTVALPADAGAVPWRDDARVIALISFAHLISHFFHLILAPLFPWLRAEYGYSYAELGFVMSVLFTVSGFGQAAAGFVVDRYGALRTLIGGLLALSAGAVCFALSDSYPLLLLGAALVGLGNCVFHPVDYWFINHRVSLPRLGPAFSAHGLSGSLGWAAAPVFLVGIANLAGWRSAVLAAAILPLLAGALILWHRATLVPRAPAAPAADAAHTASDSVPVSSLAFLRAPAIWWCFAFFFCIAVALGGVQSFAPTVFSETYGLPRTLAAMSLSIYMLASATGMFAGGWLVARSRALERNITIALALAVVAAAIIGADIVPATWALALMAVMGFGAGLSGPSRDMLIRSAAPPGATGRVYGVVYSGLDAGIALGPLVFGRMLDSGHSAEVFLAIAVSLFCGVGTAWRVTRLNARQAD